MSDSREGRYMQTYTGIYFYPKDPRPEDVSILDIAHALSNICRFGGHTNRFYSVAQHSFYVSECIDPSLALVGLLHDATEAYVGDVIRPLKWDGSSWGKEFQRMEDVVWESIRDRFDIPKLSKEQFAELQEADNRVLVSEAQDFMGCPDWTSRYDVKPYPDCTIEPWIPEIAKDAFLNRFDSLISIETLTPTLP